MSHLFYWLADYSVRSRFASLFVVCSLSLISLVGYFDPQRVRRHFVAAAIENQSTSETTPADSDPEPSNVSPISLSNSDAVLLVRSENFFDSKTIRALRAVVDDLEALDQVSSVLWMDRVPILNLFGLPEPLLPRATASESRFQAAEKKAQDHPLVGGQLLSDDGKTLLILINFDYYYIFNDDDATTILRETANRAAARLEGVDLRFQLTGRVPSAIAVIATHEANQLKYQLIGYGMILLMSLILFRGVRAVMIVSMAPAFGVFWTLGIIRFWEYNENPLIDVILPILVSLVGLTDGVHLMVQIRKLRAKRIAKVEATIEALRQVGMACFLTSLTTAIGFGSLTLADSIWVQQFGLCSTIGVLLCFIAVVTIIPLACSSPLGNRIEVGQEASLIDQHLNRIGTLIAVVLKHRNVFAVSGIILTVVLVLISLTLRPDQRQTDALPQSAETTQALYHMDDAFGGLEFARVEVKWNRSVASDDPEILDVVRQVDEMLTAEKLIGHPLSIRNLIDAQPGSGPPQERMSLLDLLPPPLKRAFYSPEKRLAFVTFRVRNLGIRAYGEIFQRFETRLEQIASEHPGFELELTGNAVRRWRNLYQIVVDLAASLGTAAIIIWLVLTLVFRSFRLGLISIIPNLFPLALTGTYLALSGYNLEVVMVCNFTVCLGIAVDDTIHFMVRYIDERGTTDRNDLAIARAFTGVGTALIMTTLVLVAGFGIVTFSDSRDHHIFATMGALTVAAALLCDLIFLPALLAMFAKPAGNSVPEERSI